MSSLSRRVWPLKFIGVNARTAVLATALRWCAPAEAEGLARELLAIARRRPDSLAVPHLAARWSLLSSPQRGELALIIGTDWPQLAAYLAQDPDPSTRASIALACSAPEVGGLGVLAGASIVNLLADPDAAVAEVAEQTLASFMSALAQRTLDDKGQAAARAAADSAIETFDHHRRTGALRTAIQHGLVTRGGTPAGGKWMNDADHPAHMVVRGLIRTSDDPAMRSCAWAWLKHPSLATACAQRLTRADSLADQSVVLERSHLALNPLRPAGLAGSSRVGEREFAGALPRLSQIDGLSLAARRGLARWLATVPISDRLRDAASAILLTDIHPLVRQSLVLSAAGAVRPPACLLDLVFDPEPTVATTAADAILSRAGDDALPVDQRERLGAVLARSAHQPLRHLAAQIALSPGGHERERAIAEAVRLTEQFAGGGDRAEAVSPRAVASAVATLASVDADEAPAAEALLVKAANLPDARVRANAVEGLLRRVRTRRPTDDRAGADTAVIELLLDRATDPHHRIRANAARGLLVCGWIGRAAGDSAGTISGRAALATAGSRTLAALLTDPRTMHRVAGLWLAHRLGDAVVRSDSAGRTGREHGAQLLDRVAHAAGRAIDPMERHWAQRARERLEGSLRERWSTRAPKLEEAAA